MSGKQTAGYAGGTHAFVMDSCAASQQTHRRVEKVRRHKHILLIISLDLINPYKLLFYLNG